MEKDSQIREKLLLSKQLANEQIEALYAAEGISFQDLNERITVYIQAKFMLDPKECEGVDFQKLSELSLSKTMKISPELVKEFDTARSCAGATSALAKKTLLYLSIQKALKIELAAEKTPKVRTFEEFSALVWEGMAKSGFWQERMFFDQGKEQALEGKDVL